MTYGIFRAVITVSCYDRNAQLKTYGCAVVSKSSPSRNQRRIYTQLRCRYFTLSVSFFHPFFTLQTLNHYAQGQRSSAQSYIHKFEALPFIICIASLPLAWEQRLGAAWTVSTIHSS